MTKNQKQILDQEAMRRVLVRLSHEILERNKANSNIVLIGIRTRGVFLAQRLRKQMKSIDGEDILIGSLDITLYRDDLTQIGTNPVVHKTEINFDVNDKRVVLVDDVLYTGRTIRSALDALVDFGRPQVIQLAVLVDRGHRELPIRADFVGKNIPTSSQEAVEVKLEEVDGKDEVVIEEKDG